MRWPLWRRRGKEEQDLAEELRAHLAIETKQRIDSGEDPAEAAKAAQRVFGNITNIQESTRETWGWTAIQRFFDDALYGVRMLRKTPAWTVVVCATLGLGIGLSTAIFSVVYGVLLRPLPYPDPSRIVALSPSAPRHGYPRMAVNAALWLHWREESKLFEDIGLIRLFANFNFTGEGAPERLQGARTSANIPQLLGVAPLLGRAFTEEEQRRDARVAILSYAFWQRRFGRDPSVLGRKLRLNGEPFEVIGIMPPEYRYPAPEFELWTPLYIPPEEIVDGGNYSYRAIGRVRRGVSVRQTQVDISAVMHRLAQDLPRQYHMDDEALEAVVEPLAASDAVQVRSTLYVLLAAVGCLLLIGCMNLGVLLIARSGARGREMAMRAALGASASRLSRQMLAEVLPLGLAGTACGVVFAWVLLRLLVPFLPAATPRIDSIGLHAPVLAFAAGGSFLVVLLAGLLPARLAIRGHLAATLQQSSRSVAGGSKARNLLVVAQVAITLVVLFGGSLFARSLQALLQVHPGFATQGSLTMHLAVTRAKYRKDRNVAEYYERMLARIRSIPGVTAAGIVNRLPLAGIAQTGTIEFEGNPRIFDCDARSATSGYFDAIGIPLKRGRLYTDRVDAPPEGLIDEQVARQAFANENPIGRRFRYSAGAFVGPWTQIVGITGHVRHDAPDLDYRPQVYWPEAHRTQDRGALVVKTASHPESFTASVVEQIHLEDLEQTVYDIRSMEEWWGRSLQSRNLLTGLVALFGLSSLLLACLGLYGVVSYTAGQRLREFGIRAALGARAGQIRTLVLSYAGKLALCGMAIGLALAWPTGRALKSLLYGVATTDPVAWTLAPVLLLAVAILAALAPARKASRTDPAVSLRAE